MTARLSLGVGLWLALAAHLPGQNLKTPAAPPGPVYKKQTILGFTVLVNDEVVGHENEYEVPPLKVLEQELATVRDVTTPQTFQALQSIPVWLEWDDKVSAPNGREGNVIARYYGGSQLAMLRANEDPRKANAVTVLSTKSLTEEHQPKRDLGRCVLLHEIAHAVHHKIVGFNNAGVKAAHQQALERGLFDRVAYAATNENEYFAEISCAYLNRLDYFPYQRDDLKRHDPVGYALMERTWGKQRPAEARAPAGFPLDPTLPGIVIGQSFGGPDASAESLKGRIVVLGYFTYRDADSMSGAIKLSAMLDEIGPMGVKVLVAGDDDTGGRLGDELADRLVHNVSVAKVESVPGLMGPFRLPHALVFDAQGKCVFRGDPFGAEVAARSALVETLIINAAREKFAPPVRAVLDNWKKGQPFAAGVAKLVNTIKSGPPEAQADARSITSQLATRVTDALLALEERKAEDPVNVFCEAERLAKTFAGLEVGVKAQALANKLRTDKAVAGELRARPLVAQLKQLDARLLAKAGATDTRDGGFQRANAAAVVQARQLAQQVSKVAPANSPAFKAAASVEKRYAE